MNRTFGGVEKLLGYLAVFKVIREGYTIRDKIVLFLSIFSSLFYYLVNKIRNRPMRLCYLLLIDCTIKNSAGIFRCRARTNDALIICEAHEQQLKQYFSSFREGNFVDIGAHVGKYTVQLARQVQNRGRVLAIEAHPKNFEALIYNIKLNGLDNVTALNIACWSENSKLQLYQDLNTTATTSYSLIDKFQGDYIYIDARKLDDILKDMKIDTVDFMKIDVESAEAEVLRGAEAVLKSNNVKRILFEQSESMGIQACRSILEKYGYSINHAGISYYLADLESLN